MNTDTTRTDRAVIDRAVQELQDIDRDWAEAEAQVRNARNNLSHTIGRFTALMGTLDEGGQR